MAYKGSSSRFGMIEVASLVYKQLTSSISMEGRRSRGGFSPPTFEEEDILFCLSYNFIQASSETFRVYVFLTFSQRVLPSHRREACVKKPQVSVGDRKAEK